MEAKGVALLQRLSGNGGLKEATLPRQSNANVRGDVQKSSQANLKCMTGKRGTRLRTALEAHT